MLDSSVSQQQLEIIMALSEGMNSTDAAAQAGVHRNTIAFWRRTCLPFRESLAHAQYDRAMFFREKAEDMVDIAYQTLHDLITNPHTSPSVRLKAAIFIVEKASTPPPQKEQVPLDIEKIRISRNPPVTIDRNGQIVPPVHKMHKMHKAPPQRRTKPEKRPAKTSPRCNIMHKVHKRLSAAKLPK